MTIIGRNYELKQLNKVLQSEKAEFVAVYGRRRVGKTFLVREFFLKHARYFFQVVGIKNGKGRLKKQLREFKKEVENIFYQDLKATRLRVPDNWHDAFAMLNDGIELTCKLDRSQKKIVLFFDELPWMATRRSGLLEAIDYFWNRYWVSNKRVTLIICGSASSWIIEKVLNNRGGLHNRVTQKLPLSVFNLSEVEKFFKHKQIKLNKLQIAQIYMALGGVPFYLEHVEPGLSAAQIIDDLCFSEKAALRNEFYNLYESLFSKADAYIELIRLIASKPYGMLRVELEAKAKLSKKGGSLSKKLKELEQSGFIREVQLPYKRRQIAYQCIDEYTLFYLKWIEPTNRVHVSNNYWQSLNHTPNYYAWAGAAFEVLCYKHINQIKKALGIPQDALAYTWWSNNQKQNAQIDLVFDRKDGAINLCEIKFTKEIFTVNKEYHERLLKKVQVFSMETKTKKQVFVSMVSANGVKQNTYSGILASVATLADLFAEDN